MLKFVARRARRGQAVDLRQSCAQTSETSQSATEVTASACERSLHKLFGNGIRGHAASTGLPQK